MTQASEVAAEWVAIDQLRPWKDNPRVNDAAVDKVAQSIKRFGFGNPILARKADGEVIAGHTRLKAAAQLGLRKVPVRYLDLDPAEAHLLALADNKLGEIAVWDSGVLASVFSELQEAGAELLESGFSQEEIKALLRAEAAEEVDGVDEGPDGLPESPVSVRGELYELGPHRLLCGDATVQTDMDRLVGGVKCQLVFTDPPYNVDYTGKTANALKIENDKKSGAEFKQFLIDAFATMLTAVDPGSSIYVCHADMEGVNFRSALVEAGWLLKQCLIWVKDVFVMGRSDFHWQHEPILYGWSPGSSHHWFGDRKQSTVWQFDRPKRSEEHPTMKPIELIEYAIKQSSQKGDIVLDPFGGSGSTLAAAKQGRVARLLELDPRYADVIRRRWTKFAKSAGAEPGSGALE